MELISSLKDEINLKRVKFDEEITLLDSLSEDIEKKINFSKVWYALLKCDINNSELYRNLVSYYFNIPLSDISSSLGRLHIKVMPFLTIELYLNNSAFAVNTLKNNICSKFFVEVKLPFKWNHLVEEKKPFNKTENYLIAEEYIALKEKNASLDEILILRYGDIPKHKRYYRYFTVGKKSEKDISFYEEYIEKEHKKYQEYCETWNKDTADSLYEFLEFYNYVYPIITNNFDLEYCTIKYNILFGEIKDKLKNMGEIV